MSAIRKLLLFLNVFFAGICVLGFGATGDASFLVTAGMSLMIAGILLPGAAS